MTRFSRIAVLAALVGLGSTSGWAQVTPGNPPPNPPAAPGGLILDLNTMSVTPGIPSGGSCSGAGCAATTYTANFTAHGTLTTLTLALRNDPGWFGVSNVSVVDTTNPSGNLLGNGDFSGGTSSVQAGPFPPSLVGTTPNTWYTFNPYLANSSGSVVQGTDPQSTLTAPGGASAFFWVDGSTGAYDGLYQNFATTSGDQYQLSFGLQDVNSNPPFSGDTTLCGTSGTGGGVSYSAYSALNTVPDSANNGCGIGSAGTFGNGVDALAYVGFPGLPFVPTPGPEPASLAVLGTALVGLGMLRRRWRR